MTKTWGVFPAFDCSCNGEELKILLKMPIYVTRIPYPVKRVNKRGVRISGQSDQILKVFGPQNNRFPLRNRYFGDPKTSIFPKNIMNKYLVFLGLTFFLFSKDGNTSKIKYNIIERQRRPLKMSATTIRMNSNQNPSAKNPIKIIIQAPKTQTKVRNT